MAAPLDAGAVEAACVAFREEGAFGALVAIERGRGRTVAVAGAVRDAPDGAAEASATPGVGGGPPVLALLGPAGDAELDPGACGGVARAVALPAGGGAGAAGAEAGDAEAGDAEAGDAEDAGG